MSLVWNAALAQKYVDTVLPKPKLPKGKKRRKPKPYKLAEGARIIAASTGELRLFYWLLAECGIRAGELAGLKLADIDSAKLTIVQSVWNGTLQSPKTENSEDWEIGLSPQLVALLWEQIAKQRAKGHVFFTSSSRRPLDMNTYRRRKLRILDGSFHSDSVQGQVLLNLSWLHLDTLDIQVRAVSMVRERS